MLNLRIWGGNIFSSLGSAGIVAFLGFLYTISIPELALLAERLRGRNWVEVRTGGLSQAQSPRALELEAGEGASFRGRLKSDLL